MNVAPYTSPSLPAKSMHSIEQGLFDFLVPYKNLLLRPDQVAHSLGRKVNFVYTLLERGKLECHGVPGREVERYMITKRSVLLYLAESANYDPADFETRIEALLPSMSVDAISRFIVKATQLRARL